jgi:TPR repeat protein
MTWSDRMKRLAAAALSLAITAAPAAAGVDEGLQAARNGDLIGAAKAFIEPVREGLDAAVQTAVPKIERSVATVEALVGDVYYYGHGVQRDYVEAARLYRRAAAKGNGMAQSNLGDIYFYGRGAPQDFAEAVKWWTRAAENNIAIAQLNLSVMYANGDGIRQDYVKAHMFANLAAAHLPAGEDRETAVKNRDIVSKLMTPEQIAEAQRLAREWRPTP